MKNKKKQDLVPLLADHFVDIEPNLGVVENYSNLLTINSQRIGTYLKYFPLLHDSWCIETDLTKTKFSMILNEFTRYVFALALIEKKKLHIKIDNSAFPLHIDFEITELTFNSVDEDGFIHPINPTKFDE